MKQHDYFKAEDYLIKAIEAMESLYDECDTSKQTVKEIEQDVEEWNQTLEKTTNLLKSLKEQMIFTFEIED